MQIAAGAAGAVAAGGLLKAREAAGAVANIQTDSTNTGATTTTLRTDFNGKTWVVRNQGADPGGIDNRVAIHGYVGGGSPGSTNNFSAAIVAENENSDNFFDCAVYADGVKVGVHAFSRSGTAVVAHANRDNGGTAMEVFGTSRFEDTVTAQPSDNTRNALLAQTETGTAARGTATGAGTGLHGIANPTGAVAVKAESTNGTALQVIGKSTHSAQARFGSAVKDQPAVFVESGGSAGIGVSATGEGAGIVGDTGAGIGVAGIAFGSGTGVSGVAEGSSGVGVKARANGGTALEVNGRSSFSDAASFAGAVSAASFAGAGGGPPVFASAGSASIPIGMAGVRVNVVGMAPGMQVIATLQGSAGTGVLLKNVVVLNGRFRAVLSKRATKTAKLAFLVLGAP